MNLQKVSDNSFEYSLFVISEVHKKFFDNLFDKVFAQLSSSFPSFNREKFDSEFTDFLKNEFFSKLSKYQLRGILQECYEEDSYGEGYR